MNEKEHIREGGYHSVVCIKQVPDTQKVTGSAMKPDSDREILCGAVCDRNLQQHQSKQQVKPMRRVS